MSQTVTAAMNEPGFQEWLDARETKNEGSLRSMASHFGSARVFATNAGFTKPFLEMTSAEAAKLARAMKGRGFFRQHPGSYDCYCLLEPRLTRRMSFDVHV